MTTFVGKLCRSWTTRGENSYFHLVHRPFAICMLFAKCFCELGGPMGVHNGGDCLWHGGIHSSHFSNPKARKPWFNSACSRAINDREVAHKRYRSNPSPETHALYISARNHTKSVLQLAKNSFINRKCQNLSNSNSPRDFWHLAKNISNNFTSSSFPPMSHPDGSIAV